MVSVQQEGHSLNPLGSDEEFKAAQAGWQWDQAGKRLWIKASGGAKEAINLQIVFSPS
jgi:hypothetical protein